MAENLLNDFADAAAEEVVTHDVTIPGGFFMDEEGKHMKKLAIFGPPGSGKTHLLVDLLLAGERLFTVSSDVGGNGLETVRNALKKLGKTHLLKNIFNVDLFDYEKILAVWRNPTKYFGPAIEKLKPTVAVWEGFSAFQVQSIDEYIMPDDLRPEKDLGTDPFVYWDKVRRATQRVHDHWLQAFPECHHVLTLHEAEPQEAEGKKKAKKRRAWIQGQAAKFLEAGYDLIVQTYRVEEFDTDKLESRLKFMYKVGGDTDQVAVKNRGYDLPDEFEADGTRLWKALVGADETKPEPKASKK